MNNIIREGVINMIGEIIIYIIGIISGFILCSIFTYIGIKNRDDEISLLDEKCKKYQEYIDDNLFYNEEFIKSEKSGEENEIKDVCKN